MNTTLRVLVIDDDDAVSRSFDRVLSEKGFAVSTARSGPEALEDPELNKYAVIFTDINMPGMSGLEVTEKIKAKCPKTPVVVITGYGTEANESRATMLGASNFIHKPFTPEDIENITLQAIREKEAESQTVEAPLTPMAITLKKAGTFARNIGLFFASPFIAIAYAIVLPAVGAYIFAKQAYLVYHEKKRSS